MYSLLPQKLAEPEWSGETCDDLIGKCLSGFWSNRFMIADSDNDGLIELGLMNDYAFRNPVLNGIYHCQNAHRMSLYPRRETNIFPVAFWNLERPNHRTSRSPAVVSRRFGLIYVQY
jgi:hypothetical protein